MSIFSQIQKHSREKNQLNKNNTNMKAIRNSQNLFPGLLWFGEKAVFPVYHDVVIS